MGLDVGRGRLPHRRREARRGRRVHGRRDDLAPLRPRGAHPSLPPSNVRKFVPYKINAKNKRDVVCVDCTHPSFPTLTHHKDCKTTPNYLRGDTSTDTVLNALTASGGWEPMRVASKVTCNHVRARRPPPTRNIPFLGTRRRASQPRD